MRSTLVLVLAIGLVGISASEEKVLDVVHEVDTSLKTEPQEELPIEKKKLESENLVEADTLESDLRRYILDVLVNILDVLDTLDMLDTDTFDVILADKILKQKIRKQKILKEEINSQPPLMGIELKPINTHTFSQNNELPKRALSDRIRPNQIETFTDREVLVQRILATSAACASIALCTLGVYSFLAIDPRRLIFRHQLISFLLFFDLLKALVLLLYPTRVLSRSLAYFNNHFCQVVGFFTATAIEGADIAILAFAVHTYLLIFHPGLSTKVNNTNRMEGGLYKYRYFVYVLSFLIPLVLASLAYINNSGYTSLVCWCYLPQQPLAFRLALSWVPRYCILIVIMVIYCLIYFHVIREFKTLGGVFTTIHRAHTQALDPDSKPSFFSAFIYFFRDVQARFIPQWTLPEGEQGSRRQSSLSRKSEAMAEDSSDERQDADLEQNSTPIHVDTENIVFDPGMHAANLAKFRKRQKIIEKQMKSIFIYPFAYCFIWLFPFILFITQIHYEEQHGPIFWINCMGAFMQPFNGFVNTLVFFYREQPWRYTIKRNFEKEHATRLDNILVSAPKQYDAESMPTSARWTRNSLGIGSVVEVETYPQWRQWLSMLRLPLFILPSEDSVERFQSRFLAAKMADHRSSAGTLPTLTRNSATLPKASVAAGQSQNDFNSAGTRKHDFSSILEDEPTGLDFRSTLEKFSFADSQKRQSVSSSHSSKRTSINSRPRQPSIAEPPIGGTILEESSKPTFLLPNNPPNVMYNYGVNLGKKRYSTRNSESINSGKKRRNASVVSGAPSEEEEPEIGEMDFLEFLRK